MVSTALPMQGAWPLVRELRSCVIKKATRPPNFIAKKCYHLRLQQIMNLFVIVTSEITMHAKLLQLCLTFCDSMDLTCQAPLSMGFSKQEFWSGLPCPPPSDLPNPGTEPVLTSPALAGGFFTTSTTWKSQITITNIIINKKFEIL